jgi:branched-chain amino acid aminotransferase
MGEPIAFLNGQFVPAAVVAISPTDAGFVQGSTVAEQLRTFGGRLFRLDDHLARLEYSLAVVGIEPGVTRGELTRAAYEVVRHNHALLEPGDDLGLSVFVTPGEYAAYAPAGESRAVVCLHTYPLPFRLWAAKYRTGQALVTTDVEQVPARCWPPGLKCRSRMHYHLADRQAARIEPGARALLLDEHGLVTEASTANLLIARDGQLATPPGNKVLQGISLAEIHELAARLGILSVHRDLRVPDVAAADEALLSSTPFCLLPVTCLNGRPIGPGVPGPLYQRLMAAWNAHAGLDIVAQAERFAGRSSEPEKGP